MRVCIVDDDPLQLEAFSRMVVHLGHQAIPVGDVVSALKALPGGVDAVLADILMPDRDGLDLIMSVRAAYPEVRIVAMSAGGRIGTNAVLTMASGLGADAVLAKPFSLTDMQTALVG